MERNSLDEAMPWLKACDLSEASLNIIEAAVLSTEAAPDPAIAARCGESAVRSKLVGQTYLAHFYGEDMPTLPDNLKILQEQTIAGDAHMVGGSLQAPFTVGAKATRISENMRIADIFASLLSFEDFKMRYAQLHKENPEVFPGLPEDQTEDNWKGFIQFVVGDVGSIGAKTLTQPTFDRLFPANDAEPEEASELTP